jgi:hypothetical protein
MTHQRDENVVRRRRRQLPPRVAAPPEVVAVEVDGGRWRSRAAACGPGVHQPQYKEEKSACLVNRHTQTSQQDPQPEPPASFRRPRRVQRLVRQSKGHAGEPSQEEAEQEDTPDDVPVQAEPERPRNAALDRVRTCVATMQDSQSFGPLVAAEAQERDFYRAQRRAFVGDGAVYNGSIQAGYGADCEPITDLLPVWCDLYLAAQATAADEAGRWSLYVRWLGACWQGRVAAVMAALRIRQGEIGEAPKGEDVDAQDPRRLVAEALSSLGHNQSRMDDPRYRREGLPVTSSLVESLVGEFNARVKGRGTFWNRPLGAEPILQLRAAVLSADERLARHFAQRPGNPYRRRQAG